MYMAMQAAAAALKAACADGQVTRAEILAQLPKVSIATNLLGGSFKFNKNHDPATAKLLPLQDRRRQVTVRPLARAIGTGDVRPAVLGGPHVFQSRRMDWNVFVQLTVNGITLGSVYALIALGYTMVYGILKLLNFAHGDVFMIGAFIGYGVLTALGGALDPRVPVWLLITLMFVVAMIGSGMLGVVIERFAYRPLARRPADRAADQRARRLVLPPEQRAAALLRELPLLRDVQPDRPDQGHPLGPVEHVDPAHPHGRLRVRR